MLQSPLTYQSIGDSITTGYKSECQSQTRQSQTHTVCQPGLDTTNVYKSYSRHLADHWGTTDWSTVARTGAGIAQIEPAAGVVADRAMIDLYKCRDWYATGSCAHEWDFASDTSHPDVITINLGTNDYGNSEPSQEDFQAGYTEFVAFVHGVHPDATIFCLNPLEYSFSPEAKYTNMMNAIKDACESFNDAKIKFILTGSFNESPLAPVNEFTSDATHPTAEGHEMFAQFLAPLLTPILRQNHPHVRLPAPTGSEVAV